MFIHGSRALIVVLMLTGTVSVALADQKPCGGDNKLVGEPGLFNMNTNLRDPNSYWQLIYNGLNAAGFVTDEEKRVHLGWIFDRTFTSLAQAATYNIEFVTARQDLNGNGKVCVADIRGTRTSFTNSDPDWNYYYFTVWDDKLFKSQ